MGGEWGVGAALALETLPAEGRGFFSGLLQEGYVCGNLLAAATFGLLFPHLHGTGMFANWRVMFMIGAFPALLAFYLNFKVEESPAWLASHTHNVSGSSSKNAALTRPPTDWHALLRYLPTFLFLVILMFAFTSFSHGTQDLYPTFLHDHGFSPSRISLISAVGNIGALLGGVCCGTFSEKLGRRKTIILAALLAIPMIPLWAWSHTAVDAGGRRLLHAVHGAGCVGHHSRAPQRTLPRARPRYPSGVCLPARQLLIVV